VLALFTNLLDQFKAIHVGHIQVRDQHVDLVTGKIDQGIKTILCLNNLVAGISQRRFQYLTNGFRVIYKSEYILPSRLFNCVISTPAALTGMATKVKYITTFGGGKTILTD